MVEFLRTANNCLTGILLFNDRGDMHPHKLLQKWETFILKLSYELLDWNVLLKKFEIDKI